MLLSRSSTPGRSARRLASIAAALVLLCSAAARAGDPVAGMALFNNVPGAVISCGNSSCHGPNPNDNVNGLQKGGNNPGVIQSAIRMNVPAMMFLTGLLNPFQLDDLAAYLAPQPALSGGALVFGTQAVGTASAPQVVTLRSEGGVNLVVTGVSVSGQHVADFAVGGGCIAGAVLQSATIAQPGGTCEVAVSFRPAAIGTRNASVRLTYAGSTTFPSTQTVALTGAGTEVLAPAAVVDPATIDFGEVVRDGASAQRIITLANPGNAPLQVSGLDLTGMHAGDFSLAGTCAAGGLPAQVNPGGSCTILAAFLPRGLDLRTAELRVLHNAAGSPGRVALSGVGIAATCAPPQPPAEFQSLACGAGLAGTVTQSREAVCVDAAWSPGPWVTIANHCQASSPPANLSLQEYYNTGLNHYFMTAEPAEREGIDTGAAGPGWGRTVALGQVWDTTPAAGLVPVCRFYGNPATGPEGNRLGPNSHFYTADSDECAAVKADPGWTYEGVVFQVVAPTQGNCPQPLIPVYRSYNGRFAERDSNHRYAIDPAIVLQMTAQGWTSEGVVLCVAAQ